MAVAPTMEGRGSLIVPFVELHAGFVPIRQTESAFGIKKTDSGLAPQRSSSIQARPAPTRLFGMVATVCANWLHVPKLVELTTPGLLNFKIRLALAKPTQRLASGSRAAELAKSCVPEKLQPVWPAGNVLPAGPPPRLKSDVRSRAPLPLSPAGR